jgi:hypothetical protein
MKRIDIETNHPIPHFIGCWSIEPLSLCDELIEFFENHQENQTQGQTAGGVNLESKNSIDMAIRPRELWPFLKNVMPRVEMESFNIQRYDPGGHFQKVHAERTTVGNSHRVLAWMTYLNDVEDGGATHFLHQDISVQPEKGKTLIWPAEWTHAHAGKVLNSGTKYIITGWMHFPPARS